MILKMLLMLQQKMYPGNNIQSKNALIAVKNMCSKPFKFSDFNQTIDVIAALPKFLSVTVNYVNSSLTGPSLFKPVCLLAVEKLNLKPAPGRSYFASIILKRDI